MVELNDLRIGNLVQSPKGARYDGKILAWSLNLFYWISECVDSIEDFKPIPLTEEILLDCGFSYYEETVYHRYIASLNGFSTIEVDLSDSSLFLDLMQVRCEHVHQLQNLFHSLTGEELEFKTLGK